MKRRPKWGKPGQDPAKSLLHWKKYREKNREKRRISNRLSRLRNLPYHAARMRKYRAIWRAELRDYYIRRLLHTQGIPITPETIELKRLTILIRRAKIHHEKSIRSPRVRL